MAAGYGVSQTNLLPSVGAANPAAMTALLAAVQEIIDTKTAKVTGAGADFSLVPAPNHGAAVLQIPASAAEATSGCSWNGVANQYWQSTAGNDEAALPIVLTVGERITDVKVWGRDTGSSWHFGLYKTSMATNIQTQVGATATSAGTTTIQGLSISALTETITAGYSYYLRWIAGATGQRVYGAEITFDRP